MCESPFPSTGTSGGSVLIDDSETRGAVPRELSSEILRILDEVPTDERVHEVSLSGLGEYRVLVDKRGPQKVVSGLPTEDIDETVSSLLRVELVLALQVPPARDHRDGHRPGERLHRARRRTGLSS